MNTIANRRGMTTIEVLASTLLASLLMAALLTVMRGLKAQEGVLDARAPAPAWQGSLREVLDRDLERSLSYVATPQSLTLTGYSDTDPETGDPTWLPAAIRYEVHAAGGQSWLVRSVESAGSVTRANLALRDAAEIRVGVGQAETQTSARESPVMGGLVIEFWQTNSEAPLFRHETNSP